MGLTKYKTLIKELHSKSAGREECFEAGLNEASKELIKAVVLLNKIAMIGCSEKAYTKDFTNEVNAMVREFLEELK